MGIHHIMDEEISVINLSESQMNMKGYHNGNINDSDRKARETSLRTVNTPLDGSKFEKVKYSIQDRQNKDSSTNDSVNISTEDETKLEGTTGDGMNVGSDLLEYVNALIIIGVIMVCVFAQ